MQSSRLVYAFDRKIEMTFEEDLKQVGIDIKDLSDYEVLEMTYLMDDLKNGLGLTLQEAFDRINSISKWKDGND